MNNNLILSPEEEAAFTQFLSKFSSSDTQLHIQDMLTTIIKLSRESSDLSDLKLIGTALQELRRSFKVFAPYRDTRKISLFGSARTPESDIQYKMAQDFAKRITEKGFMLITGAGSGVMEAGNRGAEVGRSFGVNIQLPFEQKANSYIEQDQKLVTYKYFFTRKLIFIKESDATILFPGGFGTHDEGFEILTLIQNGRCSPRPIVMISEPGSSYWRKWLDYIKTELLDTRFISPEDMGLFTLVESVDNAVDVITSFYRVYHSIKYYQDLTILRINAVLSDAFLARLHNEFSDILVSGTFEQTLPGDLEIDQKDYPEKARLVFKFNKINFGRLCQLIRLINTYQEGH